MAEFDDEICAIFLAVVSAAGISLNLISAVVLVRNSVFRNAFGLLTTLHTTANIGVLSIFLFWSCPIMMFGLSPSLVNTNKRVGQLSLFFQEVAFHACFFISINRLLAISTPTFYRIRFTRSVAAIISTFICSLSGLYISIYFFGNCEFFFEVTKFTFQFSDNPCGQTLSLFVDLIYNCSLFFVMGCMDLVTLSLLIKTKQRLSRNTITKQSVREARFFLQAVVNSIVYCLMLISFDVVAPRVPDTSPKALFFFTTGTWALGHSCGGLILVVFNREISRLFTHPKHFVSWIFDTRSMNSTQNTPQHSPPDVATTF